MKSTVFAFAALAASVEAVLDLSVDADVSPEGVSVGINIRIPDGIQLPEGVYPTAPPAEDRINVYHPPHHGVDMDDCDDDEDDDWHYVHPGNPVYPDQPPHVWTTSTVTVVHTSTIIDCDYDVPDCPGKTTHYTTVEVPPTVTICPVVPTETPTMPHETYAPPPVHSTKKHRPSHETLPIPMETPIWTKPSHTAPTSTPCPTPIQPTSAPHYSAPHSAPSSAPHYSAPPVHTPVPEHPCPGGAGCPPYAPPAQHNPEPSYPAPNHYTTLRPQVPSATISVAYPPTTPTGQVVTAGAAQNVQRVGVALAAGLVIALA